MRASARLIATAVDDSWARRDLPMLKHVAEVLVPTVRRDNGSPVDLSELDYCLANAWNGIKLLSTTDPGGGWSWESDATEQETTHLRRAALPEGLSAQPIRRRCQVLTNLGNCYSTTGRYIEAIGTWDQALRLDPNFGMARGNRGIGLWKYARLQHDCSHRFALARESWMALDPKDLHDLKPGSEEHFRTTRAEIESAIPLAELSRELDLNASSLGASEAEREYRRWCLRQRMFLNPLNEIGTITVAAKDVLLCPPTVARLHEGPRFHDYMSQIMQEFCSARWLAYEAIRQNEPHFSDHEVHLCDTLDYPSHGLHTEQLKLAFRSTYSLFDKIASFLNAYLGLHIPENRVSMRGIWYKEQTRSLGLRPEFAARGNPPLRGLFWLTKDLHENAPGFRESTDPLSRHIVNIRNHLEHKFLKLHTILRTVPAADESDDTMVKRIRRSEFVDLTTHLLRMARSAIIQLGLSVYLEERGRAADRPPHTIIMPEFSPVWKHWCVL